MFIRYTYAAAALLCLSLAVPDAVAQPAPSPLDGAQNIGPANAVGRIAAFRKGNNYLLTVAPSAIRKPFLWYSELIGVPAGSVAQKLEAASTLAQFERHGNLLIVRDLSTRATTQAGTAPDLPTVDRIVRPIELAIDTIETGSVIVAFPIAGETPAGAAIIDVTRAFSNDIENATARPFAALPGLNILAVDPARSFIDGVRLTERSLNIRSHLTFLGTIPAAPGYGPQPVSLTVGHSFIFLPEKPMEKRYFDSRVGYMSSDIREFEAASRNAQVGRSLAHRFRLEKANPNAAVSDPIKPILFYLGPGIPDRFRPYMKAGVELWKPALEAAGFSNAIRAVDAPTPQQDPNWYAEDASINVIRWVPLSFTNALGAHVIDPRSGETLSAHILIWPSVVDFFSRYYFSLFGALDPEAAQLPLSDKKIGELISYIVAHEVGHTLGLRHNHFSSSVYTVAQMRDPAFINQRGPNSSIMAYGRLNQAAQPGDGVTQLYAKLGPYDYAAIKWGYGVFPNQKALDEVAASIDRDPILHWEAGELPEEEARAKHDPRVLIENTGRERIEATQLGVANILRSLARLDAATASYPWEFAATLQVMLNTHNGFLKSVNKLIAGVMPRVGAAPNVDLVPAAEQSRAIAYLLGDGARSLEAYRDPAIKLRSATFGGDLLIDSLQSAFLADILSGENLILLDRQSATEPNAYSPAQLGEDVAKAVWGDLSAAPPWKRALQRGYIRQTMNLLEAWAKARSLEEPTATALIKAKYPANLARLKVESGDDTNYPTWLRTYLPTLKAKLDSAAVAAASESDKLYFSGMANQVEKLAAAAR